MQRTGFLGTLGAQSWVIVVCSFIFAKQNILKKQKQENHRQSYPVKKVLFGPEINLFMISLSFEKISVISKFKLKKKQFTEKKTQQL